MSFHAYGGSFAKVVGGQCIEPKVSELLKTVEKELDLSEELERTLQRFMTEDNCVENFASISSLAEVYGGLCIINTQRADRVNALRERLKKEECE